MELLHEGITSVVIQAFYDVYNKLGFGFLEKVYENAMAVELRKHSLHVVQQQPITVMYEGVRVGEYYADMIVESRVVLEIKAASELALEHEYQLMNYLKATDIEVGLLLNFGKQAKFKRKVFKNK